MLGVSTCFVLLWYIVRRATCGHPFADVVGCRIADYEGCHQLEQCPRGPYRVAYGGRGCFFDVVVKNTAFVPLFPLCDADVREEHKYYEHA